MARYMCVSLISLPPYTEHRSAEAKWGEAAMEMRIYGKFMLRHFENAKVFNIYSYYV